MFLFPDSSNGCSGNGFIEYSKNILKVKLIMFADGSNISCERKKSTMSVKFLS